MKRALLLTLALAGCPPKAPVGTPTPGGVDVWMGLGDDVPGVCLAHLPDADRPGAGDRRLLDAARAELLAGNPVDTSTLPAHPAAKVTLAGLAMREARAEDARVLFRDLANQWPTDPCLGQAAAYSAMVAGRIEYAEPYLKAALKGDPTHPDVGVPAAVLVIQLRGDIDEALTILRKVHEAHPEHIRTRAWLGRLLAQRGELDIALPHLKVAHDAGLRVDGELAVAAYALGDIGAYLSVAGRAPPMPVDVRAEADPLKAYHDLLGVEDNSKLMAIFETTMGDLHCELFWKSAPVTVATFVGLADGRTPWTHPRTGAAGEGALYSNIVFHRVIPDFMIQTGDPLGTGTGGPGFRFQDEIDTNVHFDRPGRLGMANSGPHSNGSQFFITEVPVPHLDGKHTIFGQCDPGAIAVTKAIARVPRNQMDAPATPVILQRVRIEVRPGS